MKNVRIASTLVTTVILILIKIERLQSSHFLRAYPVTQTTIVRYIDAVVHQEGGRHGYQEGEGALLVEEVVVEACGEAVGAGLGHDRRGRLRGIQSSSRHC